MPPVHLLLIASFLFTACAHAQFKTELINLQGATAPCIGIGPIGGPLARKCAEMFEQAGFLREGDVGVSGLTLGTSGNDDGIITKIDPGSPAEQAGLAVGDQLVSVEGHAVKPTPGAIAAAQTFGPRGEELTLRIRRAGAEQEIKLVRAPQTAPPGPKSPSFFMSLKPLIDWHGRFLPCMGAGPAGIAAIAYCEKHFKPYGFIKAGDLGATGLKLDMDAETAAITGVEPDSPAAKAGVTPGDIIVAVDGKPLTASLGQSANELLFGKPATTFHLTVHRGDADKDVLLTLAPQPAKKD